MARGLSGRQPSAVDCALSRVLAEIDDGLHGYFEYVLMSEVFGQERRRQSHLSGCGRVPACSGKQRGENTPVK